LEKLIRDLLVIFTRGKNSMKLHQRTARVISRSKLATGLLLMGQPFVEAAGLASITNRPNVLIILADDLGYGDVQCYNPERGKIPTPNIDRIAAQGMRFTDAHSSSAVCSPSRYALLTGRYHWRTPLQQGVVGVWEKPLIAPGRLTIANMAKQRGYHTACIGKWHLGWDWPIKPEQIKRLDGPTTGAVVTSEQLRVWQEIFSRPIPGGPTTRGFDEYFGTDVPNWPPFCFIENDRTVGFPSVFLPPEAFLPNMAHLQGPALPDWKFEKILPALGNRACAFIEAETAKTEPFFLYLALTSPHTPLAVNAEWQGKSNLAPYADFVMETDALVGRVLDALKKSGAEERTLVVFTSDNGCVPGRIPAELEHKGHYPSGPLRGYKFMVWEGGHRMPFIIRWPGVVTPGSTCSQLVEQTDLMATLAAIWGVTIPDNAGEDSFSILPLLKGNDMPVRETAVSCASSGVPAIRQGSWKLILGPGSGRPRDSSDSDQPIQLYNLANDLGETRNLAAEQPERVAQLKSQLETLIKNGRSTSGVIQHNDIEVCQYPQQATGVSDQKNRNKRVKNAKGQTSTSAAHEQTAGEQGIIHGEE
jgi:arylsulfatase A-like enzyme